MRLAMRSVITLMALVAAGPVLAEQDNYIDFSRGKALATVGDCIACHTAPGGQPFAGGLALQTPFGAIMTPNLTPDDATGIGRWSKDNFARAMHEGRRRPGSIYIPRFLIRITPRCRGRTSMRSTIICGR
jgi:mono/diheme cytochrome c family protein